MDIRIPQNCDWSRTEIFIRTSHENSAKETEKSTKQNSGGTNGDDGNILKSESKGRFPGVSPILLSGPSSNARTVSQWDPKTVRHNEGKEYRRANKALAEVTNSARFSGLNSTKENYSAAKWQKIRKIRKIRRNRRF
jgi:hypothetical protein